MLVARWKYFRVSERQQVFASMFWRHKKNKGTGYEDDIVVGKGVRIPWSGWKKFYVVGCVVLIMAASVSSYFAWQANRRSHKARVSSEAPLQSVTLKEAAQLDHEGKYNDEAALLKNYLKSNPPQEYRYKPLIILGNLAYDKRDDTGALNYYKQAVAANGGKLTEFDAENMGQAAAAAGDKATALEYFKKAIQLTVVKPGVPNNLEDLKATVKHLESTK